MNSNDKLVEELIRDGVLQTPSIIDAFRSIDRKDFVQEESKNEAYGNYPLPIGEGQTISQPYTVAFMIELVQPKLGMRILDIGSGSGWQTTLLSCLVGEKGNVVAIERISSLCEFAKKNIEKYGFLSEGRAKLFCQDATSFLPDGHYDIIIAAASAHTEIPDLWRKAVKIGGKIIAPIDGSIWVFTKKTEHEWKKQEFPGFVFVPLISDKKQKNNKRLRKVWGSFFILILFFGWKIYFEKPGFSDIREIEISKGTSLRTIASLLKEKEIIRSRWIFIAYTVLKGDALRIQAGTYALSPNPLFRTEQRLIAGEDSMRIVIPEGWSIKEIYSYLTREKISSPEKFIQLTEPNGIELLKKNFPFLDTIPLAGNLEGFLFPDTYVVFRTMPAEDIMNRILGNFDIKLTDQLREEILRQQKTIYQIIIMASLIEKEVVSDEDRAIVSGILWKRLSLGIPLQVDATISYIKKQKDVVLSLNGKISTADTKIESPYNTYKYAGLPKGPIGNPGLSAIKTAIVPTPSPYFYYLSNREGKTIFSRTLEEHNAAKAKYLK